MKKMKFIATIIYLFIVALPVSSNGDDFDGEAIVVSKSGLVLRAQQGLNSEKILTIPYNEKVKLFAPHKGGIGNFEIINDLPSNWYKVKYNENVGWVFGGFLNKINSKYSHLMSLLDSKGELEVYKKMGINPIEFTKPNGEAFGECSFNESSNSFYCDCGRGFCSVNFISIKQGDKKLIIIVEFKDCTNIGKSDDGIGPCLESSIEKYECVIPREMFVELLNGKMIRYYIKGKLISKKTIKTNNVE